MLYEWWMFVPSAMALAWLFFIIIYCIIDHAVFKRRQKKRKTPVNWKNVVKISEDCGFKIPDFSIYEYLLFGEERPEEPYPDPFLPGGFAEPHPIKVKPEPRTVSSGLTWKWQVVSEDCAEMLVEKYYVTSVYTGSGMAKVRYPAGYNDLSDYLWDIKMME